MTITISHRHTGATLKTVEADSLGGADLGGADLRYAYLRDANLRDANLRDANLGGADLRYADLGGANLGGANLGGADLRYAYLGGANLGDANLRGADLRYADLGGADLGAGLNKVVGILAVCQRQRDPYEFRLWSLEGDQHIIRAGCRTFTLEQYRAHVAESYWDTPKGAETTRILDFFEATLGAS